MTDYTIIVINNHQYHTTPEGALMIEAALRDVRFQALLQAPGDWLRLTVNRKRAADGKGGSTRVEVAGG